MNSIGEVATAAVDTLQGARKLPAEQAAQRLRDFLQTLKSSGAEGDRLADASAALTGLIDDLEQKGDCPKPPYLNQPQPMRARPQRWTHRTVHGETSYEGSDRLKRLQNGPESLLA